MRVFLLASIAAGFLGGNLAFAGEGVKGMVSETTLKPANTGLAAPSDLRISHMGTHTLTLSWQDNSTQEYGVDVYVLNPKTARLNPKADWKRTAIAHERDMTKVNGTGERSEGDIDYTPNFNTCFQVRAFIGFSRSKVSKFSNIACTKQTVLAPGKTGPVVGPVSPSKPKPAGLAAPTNLTITNLRRDKLTLNWVDNSVREYGVDIYRMDPVAGKQNRSIAWDHIADASERIDSNIKGKGPRSDDDFDLTPNTNYCYRVRAYYGFSRSEVSDFSNTACAKTLK